jgi:1-phosphofructokinase family hexose kinase
VIVTVTPNTALDVTYEVDALTPHASHRVRLVSQRAGGKGINVAGVLTLMGHPVVATGWAGGATGDLVRADLDARGVEHDFAAGGGEARRTVTVVSRADGDATVFNEAGPELTSESWHALVAHVAGVLDRTGATVLVLAGSLPPGVPVDGYAGLVRAGHVAGATVVLDTEGPALRAALGAGPDLIKPNRHELEATTGLADPGAAVRALRGLGARDVVVSAGPDGIGWYAVDGTVARGRLATELVGNPTGAGDALVAALAAGLSQGRPRRQVLIDAVAWSAAAVLTPVAGALDPDDVSRLETQVHMEDAQ